MKFLYADSLDTIDPNFDFIEERSKPNKSRYWDDQFAHEYLDEPPYDGILVSMGIVGDHKFKGKYTQSQAMRFRRDGARKFLRIDNPKFKDLDIYGDCGAFNYSQMNEPPYTPSEILEFYNDGQFTHGCSVDHVIFQFYKNYNGLETPSDIKEKNDLLNRYNITLSNAEIFIKESKSLGKYFHPIGVIQGWSPDSMAYAARDLIKMGYKFLALGGMVPHDADTIHMALDKIYKKMKTSTKLHLLGFGKIDRITEFLKYNLYSIDTTSPLLRAFKDDISNLFMLDSHNKMVYYTAIRIPQSTENRNLTNIIKNNIFSYEEVHEKENKALLLLREYDKGKSDIDSTLEKVMDYTKIILTNPRYPNKDISDKKDKLYHAYKKLLFDSPWKSCLCKVCQRCGIEMAIFRGSNRNKRRGIHNLFVFNNLLKILI